MQFKLLIILPVLLVAVACGTISNIVSAPSRQAEYSAPAHEASSASVTLRASPGDITLKPLASGGANYLEAAIEYVGTINWSASARDDGEYAVTLTEDANNLNYSGDPLHWEVGIDPALPLDLVARSASGALTLDLSAFTVLNLNADTSSGAINVTVPSVDAGRPAIINSTSGAVTATVVDDAQVSFSTIETSSGSITVNTGSGVEVSADVATSSGRVSLNLGANVAAQFTINSSSGAIVVDVPEGAAVRLEIAENSSGAVAVPGWLRQISGDDRVGVWATDGFDTAEHQVFITVERTSSGSVTVQ
ncbi:MAG: DUF4097 family beta strand repeat protein [Anaerolineae bacterium]|nr:DUF4097 family beta strand repeat protein [Anaerolineae bacterium]